MDSDVGKLFIGGISWETTEEKLKSYFRAYGEVVEAVIMKDRATGRARGFGFVVFADPVVADRVVQDKHTIDGRQVEAKKAVPRDEQQNAIRSNNGGFVPIHQARTKKIFVGGLAATVTEHDFRKYFDQFGAITDVVVMYDHGTQRPRGFGFITYDSEDAVDRVLQKSFHELKGKMVEVKRAIPKEMSPSPIRNNGSGLSGGPRGGGPYGGGYGQFNSSPIGSFGARMDSRYSSSPGVGYSPYAYGSNRSFSAAMNAVYDGNPHGGGSVNFGGSGGHGGALNAGDIFGGSGGGYGSSPAGSAYGSSTPGRNLWSSGAVGYGSNSLAGSYGYSGGSSVSGYGGAGTWGSAQSPSSGAGYGSTSAGYGNNSVSYGSSDGAYGSSNVNYDRRGSGYRGSSLGGYGSVGSSNSGSGAHEGGYRDLYSNLGYQETTQKSSAGADPFNAANIGGLGFGGYGLGDSSREVAAGEYGSRYATGSQPHRAVCNHRRWKRK